MASLINTENANENANENAKPQYYGWYSAKMKNNQMISNILKIDNSKNHIYYKDYNNNIIEITFVTKNKTHDLKWDDIVFVGELKEFYKSTDEPIRHMSG